MPSVRSLTGSSSHTAPDTRVTTIGDPARKFHVYVKSTPDGADIFLGEGKRPIGATPVTLPIDLSGVASVKLTLKKAGYEDYEQIVVDDTPLSINLTAVGAAPAPQPGAPGAPPEQPGASGKDKDKDKSSSGSGKSGKGDGSHSHHRSKSASKPPSGAGSDEPTGEITE